VAAFAALSTHFRATVFHVNHALTSATCASLPLFTVELVKFTFGQEAVLCPFYGFYLTFLYLEPSFEALLLFVVNSKLSSHIFSIIM